MRRKAQTHAHTEAAAVPEGKPLLEMNGVGSAVDVEATSGEAAGAGMPSSPPPGTDASGKPTYAWASSAFYRCLMLDGDALLSSREALRSAVEFGTILAWFYVADRTQLIAPGTKVWRSAAACLAHLRSAAGMHTMGAGTQYMAMWTGRRRSRQRSSSWRGRADGPPASFAPAHQPACARLLPRVLPRPLPDLHTRRPALHLPGADRRGGRLLAEAAPHAAAAPHADGGVEGVDAGACAVGGRSSSGTRRSGWRLGRRWLGCRGPEGWRRPDQTCLARQLVSCSWNIVRRGSVKNSVRQSPPQVLFLLYHYYNAKEIYNAIRVFIAAYVWMTGFGERRVGQISRAGLIRAISGQG